jgi:hypothetical protein
VIAVVTQKLRVGDQRLRVGEVVDASGWPRRESLVVKRYIREASPSEIESYESRRPKARKGG